LPARQNNEIHFGTLGDKIRRIELPKLTPTAVATQTPLQILSVGSFEALPPGVAYESNLIYEEVGSFVLPEANTDYAVVHLTSASEMAPSTTIVTMETPAAETSNVVLQTQPEQAPQPAQVPLVHVPSQYEQDLANQRAQPSNDYSYFTNTTHHSPGKWSTTEWNKSHETLHQQQVTSDQARQHQIYQHNYRMQQQQQYHQQLQQQQQDRQQQEQQRQLQQFEEQRRLQQQELELQNRQEQQQQETSNLLESQRTHQVKEVVQRHRQPLPPQGLIPQGLLRLQWPYGMEPSKRKKPPPK
jgi:hypothetical protein